MRKIVFDNMPTSGYWTVSDGANTTALLDSSTTAAELGAAMDAASLSGGPYTSAVTGDFSSGFLVATAQALTVATLPATPPGIVSVTDVSDYEPGPITISLSAGADGINDSGDSTAFYRWSSGLVSVIPSSAISALDQGDLVNVLVSGVGDISTWNCHSDASISGTIDYDGNLAINFLDSGG